MNRKILGVGIVLGLVIVLGSIVAVAANAPSEPSEPVLIAEGLDGRTGMGSTIGPGGALYVTEAAAGKIDRVDPKSGEVTTFASGLPQGNPDIGIGGVMDVAFKGDTAYALVTLVGGDVGGSHDVGIYRVDGPESASLFADIGTFAMENPPDTAFEVPSGVQYALQTYRDGFLVTDGHHNRVLWVTEEGDVSVLTAFENTVPTGLAVHGNTIYMAEAGPVPHEPEDGKVMEFEFKSPSPSEVASGARLLVDVEFGRGRTLVGLSQGKWNGAGAGSPAEENSGSLVGVNDDGTVSVIADGLDRPTSVDFIGNTAYIVTLGGEIWMIEDVSGPPYGTAN